MTMTATDSHRQMGQILWQFHNLPIAQSHDTYTPYRKVHSRTFAVSTVMQSYHFNLTTNNKALVVFIERKPEPPFAKAHFTASSKWQIFMQFIKIIVKKLIDEKKRKKTHTNFLTCHIQWVFYLAKAYYKIYRPNLIRWAIKILVNNS